MLDYDFYSHPEHSPLHHKLFSKNDYNWDDRGIHNGITHSTKIVYLACDAQLLRKQFEFNNNFSFDVVLRSRPDWVYNNYANIDLNNLENKLYIPVRETKKDERYTDNIAYGPKKIMDNYANLLYGLSVVFNSNIFGDPEKVIEESARNLLEDNEIEKVLTDFGFVYREK